MNRKLLLSALVVVLGAGATIGMTKIQAQEVSGGENTLIQKLVDRFGLNEAEVKAVFEEEHAAREAEMKARAEAQLTQLVTDGKITEAQKTAIIAKQTEMHSQRKSMKDSFSSMTAEERKAEMEKHKAELDAWAKTEGIEVKYLNLKIKDGRHGGPKDFAAPTAQPS